MCKKVMPAAIFNQRWLLLLIVLLLAGSLTCQVATDLLPQPDDTANESAPDSGEDEPEVASVAAEEDEEITNDENEETVPTSTAVPPLAPPQLTTLADTPLTAETPLALDNGITATLDPTAVDKNVAVTLHEAVLDQSWLDALGALYTIDTPFVSLTAAGVNDSRGSVMLQLPAAGPDSRLVALIDETYLELLDVQPGDGVLQTAVRVGPGGAGDQPRVASLAPGGSLHIAVLTPLPASGQGRTTTARLPARDPHSCGVAVGEYSGALTFCRKNQAGTVHVHFHERSGFSTSSGDQLADAVAAAMARYGELGFTAAQLSAGAPMRIVVEGGSGDPYYRSLNGVIYLPLDAAQGFIGGSSTDLLHEMAHWIQDEAYNMAWAFWSGSKVWWLETAAENMVMLQDPAYVGGNLFTYGEISTGDNRLALQQSPFQWPEAFYVHAQLLKLNMCADATVCPLSEESFVAAINKGAYPLDNESAGALINANLNGYAQYLLGSTPRWGNSSIPLDGPVANGERFGEFIQVANRKGDPFNLMFNGYAPQMEKVSDDRGTAVAINALLDKNGVYPLLIQSGIRGQSPGLPALLTVQPGAPFWYRIGDGEPQFHEGESELVLPPIHSTMGTPTIRLVAIGRNGGERFIARLRPIDLQGAWVISPQERLRGEAACVADNPETGTDVEVDALPYFSTLVGVMGDFTNDPSGPSLTWNWVESRFPPDVKPEERALLDYSGAALIQPEKITVQTLFTLQPPSASAPKPHWSWLLVSVAAVLPFRRRRWGKAVGVGVMLLALTGCFGFGFSISGTIGAEITVDEINYVGGESTAVITDIGTLPGQIPRWELKGSGVYDINMTLVSTTEDGETTVTTTTRCTGAPTYAVTIAIYDELVVQNGE